MRPALMPAERASTVAGVRAQLKAWQREGKDRIDPLGVAALAALCARTEAASGAVRHVLDARLAARAGAQARHLATQVPACSRPPLPTQGAAALAQLAAALAERPHPLAAEPASADPVPGAAFPALPAVDEFRDLWAKVRIDSQRRLSLAQGPGDGGPLNSAVLVHRALTLMSDTAPGYLQHFLVYLDNLAWLEQLQPRPPAAAGRAPRPKRARAPRASAP